MTSELTIEDLLRQLAPQVLAALTRRNGHFDLCEDAVQEALLAAAQQWPSEGIPDNPRGWLITVASRRLLDQLRGDAARQRRETAAIALMPPEALQVPAPDSDVHPEHEDDSLTLLYLCCHPSLSPASQLALTLRAVGGLTTAQIAAAFFVPEATMAQRISRAKATIKAAGGRFEMPPDAERAARLKVVLHVLYLIFNEGYTASSGDDLQRPELTAEAIRLTRDLRRRLPGNGEVAGLLALMLLTDARRAARTTPDGSLVPLAEQDRSRWNRALIREGVDLITETLPIGAIGPYQLQASIAAIHDEAQRAEDTDWPQILSIYRLLVQVSPNPMITLNHAVAAAMVKGPEAGLRMLDALNDDERIARHHRLEAVRGHLLEMAGDPGAARAAFRLAARRTTSLPERRYLEDHAARLAT
ncbi:MAG TPA: sigma-70 family RNA polymerase sigma factor [Candidatus Limnocylindrales bacterium]|nr:sigma-70 family RNA polymerase sigma factor [Candidatus Limnocylindrales bacterium]